MGRKRIQRGHGEDLPGLSIASRNQIREQNAEPTPKAISKQSRSEPMADSRYRSGDFANAGSATDAGFKVYYEKPGGRAKGGGKRVD